MAAPKDRVQLIKQESSAGGGDPADDNGFDLELPLDSNEDAPEVAGVFIQPPSPSASKDELVWIARDSSGNMLFRDNVDQTERTLTDLLTGSGGLTAGAHKNLDQLVHGIAETSYDEVTYTGNRVDAITTWTDSGKTVKMREELYTYTGVKVTQIITKQYDGGGSLVETLTETLSYTGNKLDSIDRVLS